MEWTLGGLGPATLGDGPTSINYYATDGVDEAIAWSCDCCESAVIAAGLDCDIDTVSSKADVIGSLVAMSGDLDKSKFG